MLVNLFLGVSLVVGKNQTIKFVVGLGIRKSPGFNRSVKPAIFFVGVQVGNIKEPRLFRDSPIPDGRRVVGDENVGNKHELLHIRIVRDIDDVLACRNPARGVDVCSKQEFKRFPEATFAGGKKTPDIKMQVGDFEFKSDQGLPSKRRGVKEVAEIFAQTKMS